MREAQPQWLDLVHLARTYVVRKRDEKERRRMAIVNYLKNIPRLFLSSPSNFPFQFKSSSPIPCSSFDLTSYLPTPKDVKM